MRGAIVIDDPKHEILPEAHTYDLVRFDWHPTPEVAKGYLDLTFRRGTDVRRLRFVEPTQVRVAAGFTGQCGGMVILDIRGRGWDAAKIEVINIEQDPGISFYAIDVVDLDEGG